MESKDCSGCGYFSPDFSPGRPRRRTESFEVLPAIQRNLRVQAKFILVWSFGPDTEKIKQLLECSKYRNIFGNIGNAVKVLVGTQSARENVRL